MEATFQLLQTKIASLFSQESSGHDFDHLTRVFNLALHLQETEGGNREVIGLAALAHDIHRLIQNERGSHCSPKESLPKVTEVLAELNLDSRIQEQVLHCIEFHEEYAFSATGVTVTDIETLILQDADNLDAIGAIGIARTFVYSGAHGVRMWDPAVPFEEQAYDDSKHDASTLHHFHNKLLRLSGNMNTATGKKMAQARHEVMEAFVEQFMGEWKGER